MADVGGFSKALTGWTGIVSVDGGVSVTPVDGDSVASVCAKLVAEAYLTAGVRYTVVANAAGVLQVSQASSFTMILSGTTASNLNLAVLSSGQSSYSGLGAHVGGYYPAYGVQVAGGSATRAADPVADGTGAGGMVWRPGRQRVTAWDDFAGAWAAEAAESGVYDVWHDGRILTRVHVTGWTRSRPGKLASGMMRLEARAVEVAA